MLLDESEDEEDAALSAGLMVLGVQPFFTVVVVSGAILDVDAMITDSWALGDDG